MKTAVVIIVAAMLSGCINTHPTSTAEWSHPEGHSADRIAQEIAKCRLAAVQAGVAAPQAFAANGGINYWVAKRADTAAQNDFVRNCMIANGYTQVK
jgi:hypothetical protein